MRIGELAKQSGVPSHTIRFYESKGLLPQAQRGTNGYRNYSEDAVDQLAFIQFGQRLGFSLNEMISTFVTGEDWDHDLIMDRLNERLKEVTLMQARLAHQQSEIKHIKKQLNQYWSQGDCMPLEQLTDIISLSKI